MTNEWGEPLDSNGYAPSVVQADTSRCFMCMRSGVKLDRHEIFGNALRAKSKRMGLWVALCHEPCHLTHAHGNAQVMDWLHRVGESACLDTGVDVFHWWMEDGILPGQTVLPGFEEDA